MREGGINGTLTIMDMEMVLATISRPFHLSSTYWFAPQTVRSSEQVLPISSLAVSSRKWLWPERTGIVKLADLVEN